MKFINHQKTLRINKKAMTEEKKFTQFFMIPIAGGGVANSAGYMVDFRGYPAMPPMLDSFLNFGVFPPEKRYSEDIYSDDNVEIMTSHLKTLITAGTIHDDVVDRAIKIWTSKHNKGGTLPTLRAITLKYLSEHKLCMQEFVDTRIPENVGIVEEMFEHSLKEFGNFLAPCRLYGYMYEYYRLEKKFPSRQEFTELVERIIRLADPNAAESKNNPTKNLERLPVQEYKSIKDGGTDANDLSCPMCQENFKTGEKCHVLPCGHLFHVANGSECVGILSWLKEHDTCPMCRKEILLK